jgi:chemosensory pili system protein ChpA (sensor histidine kinase/response regulator)
MTTNAPNPSREDLDVSIMDLSPLAWVLEELRKSLDSASKALKRFVREAGQAQGAELAALDASQLRLARQQLHQAAGALDMVGMTAPALVLRAMETAVQRFIQSPALCTAKASDKIELAGFALTAYLEDVMGGKAVSAVSLFPQYRDIQGLVGADRVHPADLWVFEWRWLEPALPVTVGPTTYSDASRQMLDRLTLKLVRGGDAGAAQNLSDMCLGLAQTDTEAELKTFWKIAAGFFEALALRLLKVDVYAKRAILRILLQYANLARGMPHASDRLAQDLLFLCTQAAPGRASDAPVLSAVRASYGLERFLPVDYEALQFDRFAPALITQARKRIGSAKESWSSVTAGDLTRFKMVSDQFSLVTDSLVKLHPPSEPLAQALTRAIEATAASGQAPSPDLGLEVATALLYLEAAFDDLDPKDAQLTVRSNRLAQRLDSARSGPALAPDPWMEALYRRHSDKQTMESVVNELRNLLGQLEKSLDNYFRTPEDKTILAAVPGQLEQMRGVMAVLDLDQAALAVTHMRDLAVQLLQTGITAQEARAAGTFDRLGNNLGALSFLIDMLNYQPALARKNFTYNAAKGELQGKGSEADQPA